MLTKPITITIPLDPKTKKNDHVIRYKTKGGKQQPYVGNGNKTLEYANDAAWFLKKYSRLMIDSPVNVKALYYRRTRIRVDLNNLHSMLHDVLASVGVVKDDCAKIIAGTDGSRVRYDKNNPRTEITITPMEDEEYQVNLMDEISKSQEEQF